MQPAPLDVAELARRAFEIARFVQRFGGAQVIVRGGIAAGRFGQRSWSAAAAWIELALVVERLGVRGIGRRVRWGLFRHHRVGGQREREEGGRGETSLSKQSAHEQYPR